MYVSDLLFDLDKRYPFMDAESWDNIGLQIGDRSREIDKDKIYVALDVTSEVIKQVPQDGVLIVHHPLFFKGIKSLETDSYVGKMSYEIMSKGITLIVLHTNYDKHFLNRYFVEKVLKKEVSEEDGGLLFYEDSGARVSDSNYPEYLRILLKLSRVGIVDCGKPFDKVAVCTGSGSSMMSDAKRNGAGLLLTGDITHHAAIEAKEIGISLIDISHFSSEIYFGRDLVEELGFKMLKQTNPIEEM